jgi:hypothetical protein
VHFFNGRGRAKVDRDLQFFILSLFDYNLFVAAVSADLKDVSKFLSEVVVGRYTPKAVSAIGSGASIGIKNSHLVLIADITDH